LSRNLSYHRQSMCQKCNWLCIRL